MSKDRTSSGRWFLTAAMAVFALTAGTGASHAVEIFKCGYWPNSSLSHRGDVTIALDKEVFTWRADTASSTAEVVRIQDGQAAYIDEVFIYLVFGNSLFEEVETLKIPILVRRIPLVRRNAKISEIECR